MFIDSKSAEKEAVLNAAYAICAAARTAPKACGIDRMETAVLTGDDKDAIAAEMRRLSEETGDKLFARDAGNVDNSEAVILLGISEKTRGLGSICRLCHFEDCASCVSGGGSCVFNGLDLGIALGSAVALAADLRMDTRIMFTIGRAASSLSLLGEHKLIMGIPLSVSGKSPFFDRR
jgi:uncharacterized ferredoxin-like protein